MVEHAGQKKWGDDPNYRNYMEKTNLLIPGRPAPPLPPPPATNSSPKLLPFVGKPAPKTKELV